MNNLTFGELLCFARVCSVFWGLTPPESVSKPEVEIAFEALKKMTDNRNDWTQEQKEFYKALVDFAKEQIKNS